MHSKYQPDGFYDRADKIICVTQGWIKYLITYQNKSAVLDIIKGYGDGSGYSACYTGRGPRYGSPESKQNWQSTGALLIR